MQRIMVATDFSARSGRALERAILIAREAGASLILAHVIDADRPERMVGCERSEAGSLLAEIVEGVRADGLQADWHVQTDDVQSGILDAADAVGADLIVLGAHRNRLRDIFVGTTVERIVRRTRLPLLVAVHPPVAAYRKTLLAIDFSEASKAACRAALEMGIFDHTHVSLMHAFEAPAEGMMRRAMLSDVEVGSYVAEERLQVSARLDALLEELNLPVDVCRTVAMTGTPEATILESAKAQDADLIVMGASQRKGLERLLVGSVAEGVIRDTHRDVLIVPADE